MTLWADVRYACRTLRKAPLFTILTALSVALGIGANATIFTLLDQIVLRPLPIDRPDELVQLRIDGEFNGNTWGDETEISYPMYGDFRDRNQVFSGMFAQFDWPIHLTAGGSTERVAGELVSGTYFPVLGVGAAAGRLIGPADDHVQGAHPVAVLSYGFWQSRFAGDQGVIGRKVTVNGHPFTIIGVARRGFTGIDVGYMPQVFVPMMMKPQMTPTWNALDERRSRFARVFARLRPGVTPGQAEGALQPFFKAMRREELKAKELTTASEYARREFLRASVRVVAVPQGHSGLRDGFTEPLWTLMAIVIGVLLITCANVAGLLVARGITRQREMAIRLAIGGSRARVVRQLLVESLVLAALGAAGGLLIATWGTSLLLVLFDRPESAVAVSSTPDARIVAFTMVLAAVTGLLFGLVPALQSTKPSLAPVLKEQSGAIAAGGPVRLRKLLVVVQVALSLLLLVGAGLFVRSLRNLIAQNPGFDTTNLVTFAVDPSLNGYAPDHNKRLAMTLVDRISSLPGVTSASIAGVRVLDGGAWTSSMTVEGYSAREGESVVAYNNRVMPGYFTTLRIPLVRGRDFTTRDVRWGEPKEGEPGIAIANQRFVEQYFRRTDPIGRHVGFGANPGTKTPIEIVGVVGTAHYVSLRDEAEPQLFFPMLMDAHPRSFIVYVRSTRAPDALFASIRRTIHAVDANLPIFHLTTMEQQLDRSLTSERLVAGLSGVLGVLATLLAIIGLYGVMAYNVTRRTREVGIRMALGAQARGVVTLFVREAGWLVAAGFLIGLPSAWAFGRYVQSQLYGVEPLDPLTISVAALGLGGFAAAGALIPAMRAARINPLAALREE
jgi:predicted permease